MLKDMIETYKRMPPVEKLDREIFLTSYILLNIALKCDVTASCPILMKHLHWFLCWRYQCETKRMGSCKISLNAFKRPLTEAACVPFTKVQLLHLSHAISVCSEEIMFVDEPSYLQQLKNKRQWNSLEEFPSPWNL